MAANYTASTTTIFLNVVESYFWLLNSFPIQKITACVTIITVAT